MGTTGARLDLFYPIFLTLQFAFFVGWLKVRSKVLVDENFLYLEFFKGNTIIFSKVAPKDASSLSRLKSCW